MKEFNVEEFLNSDIFTELKVSLKCAKEFMSGIMELNYNYGYFIGHARGIELACGFIYKDCEILIEENRDERKFYIKYRSDENNEWRIIAEI